MTADPLTALIVDEQELARDELGTALSPFVRFTGGGALLLQAAFDELDAARKVLCVLLALQAVHILGLRNRAGASPQDIVSESGMAPGTVRPTLTSLKKRRLVEKQASGDYVVALHAAQRAVRALTGDRV